MTHESGRGWQGGGLQRRIAVYGRREMGWRRAEDAMQLVGPAVPPDFVDDGCSMAPDGWWRAACRVHDYEYHLIWDLVNAADVQRERIRMLREAKAHRDKVYGACAELRYLKSKIKHARRTADINLKENMRRCSEQGGALRRASGWLLSRRYYGAVHRWGWKAVNGPGHAGN